MQSNSPERAVPDRAPGRFDLRSANGERRAEPPRREGRRLLRQPHGFEGFGLVKKSSSRITLPFRRVISPAYFRPGNTARLGADRHVREQHEAITEVDEFGRFQAESSRQTSFWAPMYVRNRTIRGTPIRECCLDELSVGVVLQVRVVGDRHASRSRRLKASTPCRMPRHNAAWRRRERGGSLPIRRRYATVSRGKRSSSRSPSVRLERWFARSGLRTTSTCPATSPPDRRLRPPMPSGQLNAAAEVV